MEIAAQTSNIHEMFVKTHEYNNGIKISPKKP